MKPMALKRLSLILGLVLTLAAPGAVFAQEQINERELKEFDYVDLLGEITIEDELAQAVELREAKKASIAPEDTVWVTIRNGWGIPDLPAKLVEAELAHYTKSLPYTQRMAFRSRMYLYYIVSETQKRGMPTEIALLPFVESAYQPQALSQSKAAGLWQFLPSTGDIFDLRQSSWRDDRLDVVQSTHAALDYLQKLYGQFGDWHLALAAYNWGEGSIRRAIATNKAKGLGTDFMSLPLPTETARYVPKLLAIKALINEPEKYGLTLPTIANEPYFVQVNKNRDLDIETAAQLAETDLEEFRQLNPGFNRPVILGAHQRSILIPADKLDLFVSNLINWQASGKALSNWSTYQMGKKDTLASVARRFKMTEDELRAANKIPMRRKVQAGSTLLVKNHEAREDISQAQALTEMQLEPLPNKRRITYRVRKGDTLGKIAQRFKVTPAQIRKTNHLRGNTIRVGQRLTLEVYQVRRKRLQPTTYRVRAGDSIFTIAQRFHVSVSALKDANNLTGEALIRQGQRLTIPR